MCNAVVTFLDEYCMYLKCSLFECRTLISCNNTVQKFGLGKIYLFIVLFLDGVNIYSARIKTDQK